MGLTPRPRIYGQTEESKQEAVNNWATDKKAVEGKTPKPEFVLGGDNTEFYDNAYDPDQLRAALGEDILRGLLAFGVNYGYSQNSMGIFFSGNWTSGGALGFLDDVLQRADRDRAPGPDQYGRRATSDSFDDPRISTLGSNWYATTADGYEALRVKMWQWYQQNAPFKLPDLSALGSGSGPSRGRGSRGPTAEDIRNQFDLDKLSEVASTIWKGMLLEDTPDARKMSRAYVDAIVASGGKKKIDFTEFIRGKAKKTARHASVYQSKPDALTEEQYLQPYFQAALQAVRPDDAADIAIGGAQFGADAGSFNQRLRRDDAVTGSSNFINQLQGRLSNMNKVFKG